MVQDYAQQLEIRIASTMATSDSIEYLAGEVIRDIENIDTTIKALIAQRRKIVSMMEPFFPLYQSISGESLLAAHPDLAQLEQNPAELNEHDLSEIVLELAEQMWEGRKDAEPIHLGQLETLFKAHAEKDDLTIPWSNPGAVISTILRRSGDWNRVSARRYERTDDPFAGLNF